MNETVDPKLAQVAAGPAIAPARKASRLGRLVLVLVLAAAALLAWRYFEDIAPSTVDAGRTNTKEPPPQTVRAAPTVLGDMPLTLDALGTVTPFVTVTVRTQIAGKLQEVGFEEGQLVKAGDFLAQIDPRPYQAALDLAQGQSAKDQALLAQAESDLVRYQTLNKQDSIARQQVDSQASLVAQDKAAIAADQAQIDTAKLNLGYTRIVSPAAGRVGLRMVDPGNYLQPSDANGIVVVAQIEPISVVFSTPEDNIPRIAARLKSGAKLPVTVFDRANVDKLAEGTLTTFDNQVDVTTGTIKMRATFDNAKGTLFPNQFVNVRLLVDTQSGVVLAPNAAIQIGASGSFVYVVGADSTVAKRDVVTGPTDGKQTVVASGLAAGESLVIDGVDRLRDGAKVNVVDGAAAAPGTADKSQGSGAGRRKGQRGAAGEAGGARSAPAQGAAQ